MLYVNVAQTYGRQPISRPVSKILVYVGIVGQRKNHARERAKVITQTEERHNILV